MPGKSAPKRSTGKPVRKAAERASRNGKAGKPGQPASKKDNKNVLAAPKLKAAAKRDGGTLSRVAPKRTDSKNGAIVKLAPTVTERASRAAASNSRARLAAEPMAAPVRRKDSGLNRKDLEQFREMLLIKRAQLIGDVNTMQAEALSRNRRDAAGDLSSMPIHMADLGTDNYEQEFTLGLIEGEQAVLREIDEAIRRVDDGSYGLCLATGEPIGKARLKAQPWAKYCYEYMLAQERGRMRRY